VYEPGERSAVEETAMNIERVLYPTDFSETARQALTHALFLAEEYEAQLHLLHAVVLHEYDPNDPEHQFPEPRELLRRMFEVADSEMARMLSDREGTSLEIHEAKRKGFAAGEVILDYAAEIDADLVVMGTHGRRGPTRLLLGSVAGEVVRGAKCPVMTMSHREKPQPIEAFERILVPVDFSEHSETAVRYAEDLAGRYQAGLQLLHVVEVPTYPYFYVPPEEEYIQTRRKRANEALEEFAATALGSAVEYSTYVTDGRAGSEIVEFSARNGSDLVVISTHGLSGLDRLLMGSTTEEVVSRARVPVLTVKAFGKSLL
jgi:nucleotide-binding universal stress UspA family protein